VSALVDGDDAVNGGVEDGLEASFVCAGAGLGERPLADLSLELDVCLAQLSGSAGDEGVSLVGTPLEEEEVADDEGGDGKFEG
jgi:hypothetical protein